VLLQVVPGSRHVVIAAAGALRSVDPDRLVIKKIVLSGGREANATAAEHNSNKHTQSWTQFSSENALLLNTTATHKRC
jgi:hypothetical protein